MAGVLDRVDGFPDAPGVYMFLDERGRLLYVGKATSLRSRVRSYFTPSGRSRDRRAELLADLTREVEYVVTDSDRDALVLESNLIKRHRPRFNIRLRDDKHYPYLKVTWDEPFPRLEIARRVAADGARYFGPYTRAGDIRRTMRSLRRIFPHRACSDVTMANRSRPCLDHDMGLCPAPCVDGVPEAEYREAVDGMCQFLAGRPSGVIARIESRMASMADDMRYEEAASLRDQKASLEAVVHAQKVVSTRPIDMDVLAVASRGNGACVQVFAVREGKLVGQEYFFLEGVADARAGEQVGAFIKQYYSRAVGVPPVVAVSDMPPDPGSIEEYLAGMRGRKVAVVHPRRGVRRQLIDMARKNAAIKLEIESSLLGRDTEKAAEDLETLAQELDLPGPPSLIEGFDVSNLGGGDTVGSMVVFRDGLPDRSSYRRYRLKSDGPDDYARMAEMLDRRFARKELDLPGLVLVDGGPGQVGAALKALETHGASVPVVGLAKKEELLYLPGRLLPLRLEGSSPALRLLQRVRDEAHRFALSYHRGVRARSRRRSWLDSVPGIGPSRRKALLRHFGSLARIRDATEDELAAVPGMNRAVARSLRESLGSDG